MEAVNADETAGLRELLAGVKSPGHTGNAVWLQVAHRFGPRMPEWIMSFHGLLCGIVLLLPSRMFEQPSFVFFRALFGSENLLAALFITFGLGRFLGLIINGARAEVTPHIRVISALVGMWVWLGVSTCFGLSGVVNWWIAVYPVFCGVEILNMYRASRDAGYSTHGHS